jgi:uncharacterized protein
LKTLFDTSKDGVVLRVRVQPGAGKEAIVGTHGDALKVQVVAPPESGRANAALLAMLAHNFGVDASSLEITFGANSRLKRVKIAGIDAKDFEKRLRVLVQDESSGRRAGQ